MPNQRMSKGSMAILGMGKVAAIIGFPRASGMLKKPIRIPTIMPREQARRNPQRIRERLARICLKIKPVLTISHPSARMALGAGRNKGVTHCRRLTNSQQRKMARKENRLSQGCSFFCKK